MTKSTAKAATTTTTSTATSTAMATTVKSTTTKKRAAKRPKAKTSIVSFLGAIGRKRTVTGQKPISFTQDAKLSIQQIADYMLNSTIAATRAINSGSTRRTISVHNLESAFKQLLPYSYALTCSQAGHLAVQRFTASKSSTRQESTEADTI
jgi:hypothetical protein